MPATKTDTEKKTRTRASFIHADGYSIAVTAYTVTDDDGMIIGVIKTGHGLGYNPCNSDGDSLCFGAYLPSKQNAYDVVIKASKK
jgi:hypothetical protein